MPTDLERSHDELRAALILAGRKIRRLTQLTNGFSKKWENLWAALCLHFAWYNFVRIHRTLRVTPAMEAGIADRVWEFRDLLAA